MAKSRKALNVRKNEKFDEEKVLFPEKIVFSFLEDFSNKNEKAQNMPEVAGRLVFLQLVSVDCMADIIEFN